MSNKPNTVSAIPLSKIFLDLNNYRHEPVKDEAEAIEHLCSNEKIYELAEDIVKMGTNVMDRIGLMPLDEGDNSDKYVVREGNRRICALKLLSDPDRAPSSLRKRFQKIAAAWNGPDTVEAVIYEDEDDLLPWLARMHEGEKSGIGRRKWNSRQKQRFSGGGRHAAAQAILTQAEKKGWITKKESEKVLTTVSRFTSNSVFKEQFGLDTSDSERPRRNRKEQEFDKLLKRFIRDAVDERDKPVGQRTVNSRMNKGDIAKYARKAVEEAGVSNERVEPELLDGPPSGGPKKKTRKSKPRQPVAPQSLEYDRATYDILDKLGNHKLKQLYYSLCQIELSPHTIVISVGVWSFFECLTAAAGRTTETHISAYLQKSKLQSFGINKRECRPYTDAIERMVGRGNESKHHPFSGGYDALQINNDWVLLDVVVKSLANEAITHK